MNLKFAVLKSEPLTIKEAKLVRIGVGINFLPVLKRWVKRDKRNKLEDVTAVQDPLKNPQK